jgi:hypothetical protein
LRAFVELVPFCALLHDTCSKSRLHPSQASSPWNHSYLEKVGLCSSCLERCPLVPHCSCSCPSACQPLSEPFHFLLELIIFLAYETITCF